MSKKINFNYKSTEYVSKKETSPMSEGEKKKLLSTFTLHRVLLNTVSKIGTPTPKKRFFGLINLRNTGLLNPVFTTKFSEPLI